MTTCARRQEPLWHPSKCRLCSGRFLFYPSVSTSIHHPSIHPPISMSICYQCPSIHHHPSINSVIHPCVHSVFHPSSICPSLYQSSIHPSVCVHVFIHSVIHPSVHPAIHTCVHPSLVRVHPFIIRVSTHPSNSSRLPSKLWLCVGSGVETSRQWPIRNK